MVEERATQSLDIAVIGGDGIGPEVVAEGLKVLSAVTADGGPKVTTTDYDLGARRWHATGETLPDSVLEEIRGHDAILLGAVGDPGVPSGVLERGLLLRLRFTLDHFVNLRPARLYPGVASPLDVARVAPGGIDFLVVREGTEGPYTGNGGALRVGTPAEVATEVSVNTRFGVERVVRDAFARARARERRHLTLVHKHNVLSYAGHLWRRTVDEVGSRVPRRQHRLPARRRGDDLPDHRPRPLRRHRDRQPLRRHPHRHRGGRRRWHRAGRQRQHQPRPVGPQHVRAGARLGPGHRRPGQGRPDRDDPVGGDDAPAPRAPGRGCSRRGGRGGGPRHARRRHPHAPSRSATPSPPGSAEPHPSARLRAGRPSSGTAARSRTAPAAGRAPG